MKSRLLIAGAVIAAVIAGGAYVGVTQMEKKTEQAVHAMLAVTPAKVQAVKYSYLSKTLTLTGLSYEINLGKMRVTNATDSMVLEGFNPGCLEVLPAGSKLVPVAKRVTLTGMKGTSESTIIGPDGKETKMSATATGGPVVIEGWMENLGSLVELYRKGGADEAFFAEMYRYNLDNWVCAGYSVTSQIAGMPKPMLATYGKMGLIGKAGSPDGNELAGRTMSMFSDDIMMDVGGVVQASMKRMEFEGMLLPSPKGMVEAIPLLTQFSTLMSSPEMLRSPEKLLNSPVVPALTAWATREYGTQAPYKRIMVKDYVILPQGGSSNEMRLDLVEHTLAFGDSLSTSLAIKGIHVNEAQIPTKYRAMVKAFTPQGLLVDFSVKTALRPAASGESKLEWTAGIQGLGNAEGSADLLLDVKSLTDVFSNFDPSRNLRIGGFQVKYVDSGLLAAAICMNAQSRRLTPAESLAESRDALSSVVKQSGGLESMLQKAMDVMLDKPGTLTISGKPDKPAPALGLLMGIMMRPEDAKLTIQAEPGPKPLLDYVPASLK